MATTRLIYGTGAERSFQAVPLPLHAPTQSPKDSASSETAKNRNPEPPCSTFAEVDFVGAPVAVAEGRSSSHAITGAPQRSQPVTKPMDTDMTRVLFYELRHIAQQGAWYHQDKAEVFYRQAKLMADYIDDYPIHASYTGYYPSYQNMDYDQLRAYFTWRTEARSHRFHATSTSYVFVYIYELLNQIGVQNAQEGLDRLYEVWNTLRGEHPLLDRYIPSWLKDYHVFFLPESSFRSFVTKHDLKRFYPATFCREAVGKECFDLYSAISTYAIETSIFYTEATAETIQRCFSFVVEHLRTCFVDREACFEDSVFHVESRRSLWVPFSKAVFHAHHEQQDRVVYVTEHEVYECEECRWTGKIALLTDHGSQLIGYIMKAMEVYLRRAERFRYKITADIDTYKAIDRNEFEKRGISLPDEIEEACRNYLRLRSWTTVSVRSGNLSRIRTDALTIQEKLLVPEANEQPVDQTNTTAPTASSAPQDTLAPTSSSIPDTTSPWIALCASLNELERTILTAALNGNDAQPYAREADVMLEVLIDTINEKAMDLIGDVIVDVAEIAYVYPDYEEELRKAMVP